MNDNLNPTPEAIMAMCLWGEEYSQQRGGSMDFWLGLNEARKAQCRRLVWTIRQADPLYYVAQGYVEADSAGNQGDAKAWLHRLTLEVEKHRED